MVFKIVLAASLAASAVANPRRLANVPNGVASVPLYRIMNQTAYGMEVDIGNPPQTTLLLVDTGSNQLSCEGAGKAIQSIPIHS